MNPWSFFGALAGVRAFRFGVEAALAAPLRQRHPALDEDAGVPDGRRRVHRAWPSIGTIVSAVLVCPQASKRADRVRIPQRMRPVPYFLDTFPRSRRPDYSRHRGELRVPVAIVGGGLTGCACAAAFAAAGVKVVLLEADRIGAGATAGSAGLLRQDLDASFQASAAAARPQDGAARVAGVPARRRSISPPRFAGSAFAPISRRRTCCFSRATAPTSARRLQREYKARRDAGLEMLVAQPRAPCRRKPASRPTARSARKGRRSIPIARASAWRPRPRRRGAAHPRADAPSAASAPAARRWRSGPTAASSPPTR